MGKLINKDSSGFAALEGILIVVIIAAIAGLGYYVIHQKNTANKTLSVSSSSTTSTPSSGTTSSIDKLTQQDANTESSISNSNDSQIQTNISDANNSTSQAGSAYNESNL